MLLIILSVDLFSDSLLVSEWTGSIGFFGSRINRMTDLFGKTKTDVIVTFVDSVVITICQADIVMGTVPGTASNNPGAMTGC